MSMQWGSRQAESEGEEADAEEPQFQRFSERAEFLEIVGPAKTSDFLRSTFSCSEAFLPFRYRVIELLPHANAAPPQQFDLLPFEAPPRFVMASADGICEVPLEGTDLSVRAAFLSHRVVSLGYVIDEPAAAGALDVRKAEALGVPKGPLMGQLKSGTTVTLPSGASVTPSMVVGPPTRGRKYVHLGDTCNSDQIIPIASGADWLVHECTFDDASKHLAEPRGHSTARMAGAFARQCGVKTLLLTHFSARFLPKSKDSTIMSAIEQQAKEECPDCVVQSVEDLQLIEFVRKRV